MFDSVAVIGATGAVGTIIREILEERRFPYRTIRFLASKRSAGQQLDFAGKKYTVEELVPEVFDDIDLAIASTPDETAAEFVPWATARNCVVVDESGYWRMKPEVPLIVPNLYETNLIFFLFFFRIFSSLTLISA